MVATTNAIAKIAAVVAGLGLVAMSFASFAAPAKAATADELQAQINALLAQIAAMNGGSSASATFTMDLTLGSSGAEVTALQNWLIKGGYAIPAGATGYFGAQTQAALASWQKANGVSPAAGYFGPVTRAKVNAMAGGSTGSTGGTTGLSGGEASLEDFNSKSGDDDTVDENGSGEVAVFDFDVRDGDVKIERVDLSFEAASGNDETNPWDTFDTVTLMVNGKKVASEDVSDEDNWLENDTAPYTFRFSGLNAVVKEDDNAEIAVEVETQNGIDGVNDGETWTVSIRNDDVRAIDGAGIDQYTGDNAETVNFDIQAEGGDDELSIRSSTDDPDATTLKVETSKTSDWYTIFVFDLEADDQGGDIDVDQLGVNFNTSTSTSGVINDTKIVIDGEEFTDFDWVTTGGNSRKAVFNVDKDFTIKSGERVPVEVMTKFKAQNAANYPAGTTIAASTTGAIISGEGADDLTATGASTGETHTLQTSGINVKPVTSGFSAVTTTGDAANDDYGTFKVKVDVTAFDEDIFISQTAALAFNFQFENASNGAVIGTSTVTDASSTTMSISSSAETDNGQYRINEGDTESFTFTTTVDPGNANQGKSFRMQLLGINFGNDNVNVEESSWTASPASDYETDGTLINN